jgi:ABC-2 type transport system ATP-binding protein
MNSETPLICIRGLTKSYGAQPVLRGIDLDVLPGQVLGYIGPNGAGKTTTVKILTGMLDEFGGTATVCGFDVQRDSLEIKRRIGYVPEFAALYEGLTPREYLTFIGCIHGLSEAETKRRSGEMLELLGLSGELDHRINTFSKGMRQKVLLVAGLLHNPEVIFLDEPLSGLDANAVVIVKEIIAQLARQGRAIFYCSHVMDVVERLCDRIIILNEGRIVADGTFEQLRQRGAEASLERIFTQLTSAGGHAQIAAQFVATLGGAGNAAPNGAAQGVA